MLRLSILIKKLDSICLVIVLVGNSLSLEGDILQAISYDQYLIHLFRQTLSQDEFYFSDK